MTKFLPNTAAGSTKTKEFFDAVRRKAITELDAIIEGKDEKDKIEKMDRQLTTYFRPKRFDSGESSAVQAKKEFQELCIFVTDHTNINLDTCTTLEFYLALDYIEKKNKPVKKNGI